MPKLIDEFVDLNHKLILRKEELAQEVMQLVQEFTKKTGLLVRSIEPTYIETTTVENPLLEFIANSVKVYTDVDVRGIGNRIRE